MSVLALAMGFLAPSWQSKIAGRLRPSPYAPNIPDQTRVAMLQLGTASNRAGELVPPLQDVQPAGSEQDYWTHDAQNPHDWPDGLFQPLLGNPGKPASWYMPGDPGEDPADPTVLADFDRTPNPNMTPWGGSTRTVNTGAQHALTGRLNPPTAVTPSAKDVYAAAAAKGDVLSRLWED